MAEPETPTEPETHTPAEQEQEQEPEPEPEPEPDDPELVKPTIATETVVPVLSQKCDAVQQLCAKLGFGAADEKEMRAPCGFVALSVARWLTSPPVAAQLTAACATGWPAVTAALAPLSTEATLLPLLENTIAEVLPLRAEYVMTHEEEFPEEEQREAYRRGLVGAFEISHWLRRHGNAQCGTVRNVQCGTSAAERVRFWSDLTALEADASALAIEKAWVREEGEDRPSSVDFLVETVAAASHPGGDGGYRHQTPAEWAAGGPVSGTALIVDSWGHYSVLLYLVLADGPVMVLLDSMAVAEAELPTPQGEALLLALAADPRRPAVAPSGKPVVIPALVMQLSPERAAALAADTRPDSPGGISPSVGLRLRAFGVSPTLPAVEIDGEILLDEEEERDGQQLLSPSPLMPHLQRPTPGNVPVDGLLAAVSPAEAGPGPELASLVRKGASGVQLSFQKA